MGRKKKKTFTEPNAACPCGSGKKYKNCCGAPAHGHSRRNGQRWIVPVILVAGVIAMLALSRPDDLTPPPRLQQSTPPQAVQQPAPQTESTSGWYYNAERNQHWDPTHKHWHEGPPPQGAGSSPSTGTPPAGAPEPYQYDAAKNQYWDPMHNHWHEGKPPAGAVGESVTHDGEAEATEPTPQEVVGSQE